LHFLLCNGSQASAAQIEAIAIYLVAYATLAITGRRLGDIYGYDTKKAQRKNVLLAGVLGFTVKSL
jgi:hypothetical protein